VCTGTPTFTSTSSVTNGAVGASGDFTPTASGTFNWQALYSGDLNNASATSACGTEVLTVNAPPALVTRTLGFWQTHTEFTESIFANELGGTMPIGTSPHKGNITTDGELFGAFYASIPKMTDGAKRSTIDQARMQLLQQLVAAKLNCAAFGCSSTILSEISAADAAYAAGASASDIRNAASQLDAYNNSGDTGTIPSSLGSPGKATPSTSKSTADLTFWDAP